MFKKRPGITSAVLWSIFFVPWISFLLILPKFFHVKASYYLSKLDRLRLGCLLGIKTWGILFLLWGSMILWVVLEKKSPKLSKDHLDIIMTFYYAVPFIINGILLFIYSILIDRRNQKLSETVSIITLGNYDLQFIEGKMAVTEKKLLNLLEEAISNNLLTGIRVDLQSRKVIPQNEPLNQTNYQTNSTTETTTWKCAACGANNTKTIRNNEMPKCDYCGSAKE